MCIKNPFVVPFRDCTILLCYERRKKNKDNQGNTHISILNMDVKC